MMKSRAQIMIVLLVSLILSACGTSATESKAIATPTSAAPTAIPLPTNTPAPTSTPTSVPTDTPAPTPTPNPLAGWGKFEGVGVEIWLPESYVGGNLENDLGVIVDKLKALGPDFEQVAAMIESNPTAFALWAFDTEAGSSGYLTNVNIIKEQVLSAVTLEMYMQALQQQLPSYLTITEQDPGKLERYDSIRLVIDTEISGVKGKELMYIIQDDNMVYGITFATSLDEFEGRLPDFEKSVQTFIILP